MQLDLTAANNSFKPNLLRYANHMAEKACHVAGYALQFGLTWVLGGMESNEELVMRLERELLEPAVRADHVRLDSLLAHDFHEVGSREWSFGKPEVLARLPEESGIAFRASGMLAHTLAPGVILVTYNAERTHEGLTARSLRSSVWVENAGGWQMRYHQGTAVGESLRPNNVLKPKSLGLTHALG